MEGTFNESCVIRDDITTESFHKQFHEDLLNICPILIDSLTR